MKKNIERNKLILEKWGKSIKDLPKLSYKEAQELYKEYLKETDKIKKIKIRKEIISGTLHEVYTYLNKNGLIFLNNSSYDMDDIISCSVEYLIKYIDDGNLLKYPRFTNIFNSDAYYIYLSQELTDPKYSISSETSLKQENFSTILHEMIEIIKTKPEITYKEFVKYINQKHQEKFKVNVKSSYNLANTYTLLMTIIKTLKDNNVELSELKLKQLGYLLIDQANETLSENTPEPYVYSEDEVVDEMFYDGLLDIISHDKRLHDYDMLLQRFGLLPYEKPRTFEEIGENKHITSEAARTHISKMIWILQNNGRLTKYAKDVRNGR